MSYTINRMSKDATLEDIDARTRAALSDNGFGVLTGIDVKATMKQKLDVEMPAVAGDVRDLLANAVAVI